MTRLVSALFQLLGEKRPLLLKLLTAPGET